MENLASVREGVRGPGLSGQDYVALAQQGDLEALSALYDLHYQDILRYLWSRLGNPALAEDLTGDVFRRMLASLPRYRSIGLPFRAWLFRIAHNLLIDHYRQASQHVEIRLEEAHHHADPDLDPAAAVEEKMTMAAAHRALAELEPAQRDVLALRFLSGLSVKETALSLGKTEDAVKALQRRGLAALRLSLAPD